ncbi:MAG TPA: type II CAAX endopeptidase family protein [Candidatus Acidoferrum sp.]|jgi:membrane protease YdiL (CAAX protease family)|nr:type II CAAX endopeptidase family protein [Candidatus Acidoferrum sp.]
MLSAKPWKVEAIARLLLGVLLCFFCGSLAVTALHYRGPGGFASLRVYLACAGALSFLIATVVLLHRPWRYEAFVRHLLALLFCFIAGLVLSLWAQETAGPPSKTAAGELMLIIEPAVLILFALFLREHHVTWNEAFGLADGWRQAVLYGLMAACIFLPVGWTLQWVSAQAMVRLHLEPQEQEVVQTLRASSAWLNQASLGIVAIGLAPVVEETFFRGILYPALKQTGFPRLALWVSALLFALIHFNVVSFVPLLLLAIMLTLLYEYTGNLLAPIVAHALFNTVNFAVLFMTELRSH